MRTPKLIILRGPAASGKSTVAKALQQKRKNAAVIEQDHFNHHVYKAADSEETRTARHEMVKQCVFLALGQGHDVIMDGIFGGSWIETFGEIMAEHPDENYIFYFDIGPDETSRRHATRPKAQVFSVETMKEWHHFAHKMGHAEEVVITEDLNEQETIDLVARTSGLQT